MEEWYQELIANGGGNPFTPVTEEYIKMLIKEFPRH
jgi:hypothetical protein